MLSKKRKLDLLALLSVIPLTLAIQMIDTPLNWGMYVLVFLCGIDENFRNTFRRACIVGFATAVINFSWIIRSATEYTGSGGVFIGIIVLLAFCIFFMIYANIISQLYVLLRWHNRNSKFNWVFNSLLAGCLVGALDIAMSLLGKGFTTCMFLNYIPLAQNIYALQPASYIGPFVISFFIGMTNFQVAYFIRYKQYIMLTIPVFLIFFYLSVGYLIYQDYSKQLSSGKIKTEKTFKAALICENLLPSYTWDSTNGNQLISKLFNLNRQAAANKSNLAIWPETAIPWPYSTHDDFLQELNKQNTPADMSYIIGMNTVYQGNIYYNSMYSFSSTGSQLGRYDKREALYLAEKPMAGMYLPFLANYKVAEGDSDLPLPTKWGKAGILLCNESAIGQLATKTTRQGAQFLINAGNDGWVSKTYIVKQHFYYARMRAVENRKDIVINNNNGISGLVKSTGDIVDKQESNHPTNLYYTITPNNYQPPIVRSPYFAFSLIFGFTLFLAIEIANIKWNKHRWLD